MPGVTAGNVITSSNQIGNNTILTQAIKDGEIVNADISASAGIMGSKLASNAGINDTQLNQVATAGKVSGAALTALASIPAGAGVVPAANLPANAMSLLKAGSGTSTNTAANDLDTIAISGLTATDILVIYYTVSALTAAGGTPDIRSTTDSTPFATIGGGTALGAGNSNSGFVVLQKEQQANTIFSTLMQATGAGIVTSGSGSGSAGGVLVKSQDTATAWTGSWTLGLRSSGVTATGTLRWSWKVFKVATA
jgi:hypothetical protein